MSFTHTVKAKKDIDDAITTLTEDLKEIGFGVLETLDFKKILSEKRLEFADNYKLMEVCNPNLAKQVLEANPDLELLLPTSLGLSSVLIGHFKEKAVAQILKTKLRPVVILPIGYANEKPKPKNSQSMKNMIKRI